MGKVRKTLFLRKTKYKDKAEPPKQQVQGTRCSDRSSNLNLEDDEKEVNLKDFYYLTENETNGINTFLSKDLYEKELKFKRPTAEVKCITDGVKTMVQQLMAAVGDKEPLLEISHTHLVGSMAEGTSIGEPCEFDFLVLLRHYSEPGAISYLKNNCFETEYDVFYENIDLSLKKSEYVRFTEDRKVKFEDFLMSKLLKDIILSIPEPLRVETDHGNLTLNSTTVCHHGPASVVKLRWKPKSKSSAPLDILIDITPCIEQKGIDKIKRSKDIPDGYKSHILNDDTFMLIPIYNDSSYTVFESAITTTEVNIVNTLSSHHKTSYMILKYCFNLILHNDDLHHLHPGRYHTLLPSYYIKTFLLRHVLRCESEECLLTCVLDIIDDLKDSSYRPDLEVDGIFGTVQTPRGRFYLDSSTKVMDNVIEKLVQIGKKKCSLYRHEDFRKACHRTVTHYAIQERAARLAQENVECHLSVSCEIHNRYYL